MPVVHGRSEFRADTAEAVAVQLVSHLLQIRQKLWLYSLCPTSCRYGRSCGCTVLLHVAGPLAADTADAVAVRPVAHLLQIRQKLWLHSLAIHVARLQLIRQMLWLHSLWPTCCRYGRSCGCTAGVPLAADTAESVAVQPVSHLLQIRQKLWLHSLCPTCSR